jgi:hypothetical protein
MQKWQNISMDITTLQLTFLHHRLRQQINDFESYPKSLHTKIPTHKNPKHFLLFRFPELRRQKIKIFAFSNFGCRDFGTDSIIYMGSTLKIDTQKIDTQKIDTQKVDTQKIDIPKRSTPKRSTLLFSFSIFNNNFYFSTFSV